MIQIIGPLLTGILLGASFPPSTLGLLSLAAYVPLIGSIVRYAPTWSRWKTIGMLYVTFFVYHVSTNWWISSWQEQTDPYLFVSGFVLDLLHPFFLMIPWVVIVSVRRRAGVTWMCIIIPFALSGFEWLHGQTDASYPWLTTGYMLAYTPLAQVAEFIGVYGVSFLIAVVNVCVFQLIVQRFQKQYVIALATFIAVWVVVGVVVQTQEHDRYYNDADTLDISDASNERTIRVALVQPNENPWDKWSDPRHQLTHHIEIVDSIRRSLTTPIDMYVWSETAIPFMILQPEHAIDRSILTTWIDTSGIALLTGFADLSVYSPGTAPPSARRSRIDSSLYYDVFNAAMITWPHVLQIPIHRKSQLTPFAERLPFADQLTFAMSWIQWGVGISSWGKGRVREPLPLVSGTDTLARIGVIICIESIYPEMVSDVVNNGADVLCVITNDAWYNGTWGPRQHFDIARLRAIEQRRVVLRCANSGITGAIAPDGSTISEIPAMTQGSCNTVVRTSSVRTVYSRIGDVIPVFGLIASVILFLTARFTAVIRKMPFHSQ